MRCRCTNHLRHGWNRCHRRNRRNRRHGRHGVWLWLERKLGRQQVRLNERRRWYLRGKCVGAYRFSTLRGRVVRAFWAVTAFAAVTSIAVAAAALAGCAV